MRRSGSGRVARKIGAHDGEAEGDTTSVQDGAQSRQPESVVKRPTFAKAKKRSSLRISFGPGDTNGNEGEESSDTAVVTPKKSKLSRIAIENNAERARSPLVSELPRPRAEVDRPSYSKDHIAELRKSTPSTPKDLKPTSDEEDESQALDIASKFGSTVTWSAETPSAIPTQTEIQEKKARRARLAKEQEAYEDEKDQPWASDDDDDEFRTNRNEISLRPKESQKYAETRLVREDEDMAEGFDEFVEDGNISLGKKAERKAEKKRRAEMAELINNAEGDSDDSGSDDSEAERNDAFAAAQARAGTYGSKDKGRDDGARTPPRVTPLPDLGEALERLEVEVRTKEQRREMMLKKLEEFKAEKIRIAERQQYLQEQLQKTGEEYEKMREEAGMAALPVNGNDGGMLIVNRGLDSIGATPIAPPSGEVSSDE
ncbi:hypothetical protein K505DRAFT_313002 [Melanomma pulvis-pyrius CBS 109.77]|uniref:Nineteen complex-related protein 2-domain-containing protein n=1 Tax=Melanomma pulvis-pyrius CBS 109.77 TaxID=1314802 RepID=A0A6A6WZA1_9PLEO|nr:hypothetical protein K505DRAFT_313002 [Melanomma pulvis-pyrius CBS 109.77]